MKNIVTVNPIPTKTEPTVANLETGAIFKFPDGDAYYMRTVAGPYVSPAIGDIPVVSLNSGIVYSVNASHIVVPVDSVTVSKARG